MYCSAKYYFAYVASDGQCGILQFKDSDGTIVCTVLRNTTGYVEIRLGTYNGTLLDTGDIILLKESVYLIEIYYKPANSGGVCTVKINGVTDATYSGDTTAGLENVQTLVYGKNGASVRQTYIDDIIVSDTTWLGNVYITGLVPKSAGDSTTWDPSTGSNYTCVDEVPASDTDYISTNTADETDLYNIDSLTGTIGSVLAVELCIRAAYEGTPTPTKIKHAVKIGGTEYYGSDISPTLSFLDYFYLWDQNPNTSDDWSNTNITDLQIGVKSVA